jgi:hypothetical protein
MASQRDAVDPIADYIEWTEHRYDPGYYLGGRLPPHLRRASLGRRARRRASVLLGILGLMTFLRVLDPALRDGWQFLAVFALPALMFAAALRMYPWQRRSR